VAKEIFMTQWFNHEMVLAGDTLIKRLDHADANVQAAFWLLADEGKMWELVIASPLVASEGPRNYYLRIHAANEAANSQEEIVSLHDIHVVNMDYRLVKTLFAARETPLWDDVPWLNRRLGKNFIGNVYFEDMYIYRMTSLSPINHGLNPKPAMASHQQINQL
jgi:hypothetical protein